MKGQRRNPQPPKHRSCPSNYADVGVQFPENTLNTTSVACEQRADHPNIPSTPNPPEALNDMNSANGSVQLSLEQNQVLELVKSGQSIFFTGPAGML